MYTLVAGNCSLITMEFLDKAFPSGEIVLLGKQPAGKIKSKRVTCYSEEGTDEKIRDLVASYHFDRMVYFSDRVVSLNTKDEALYTLNQWLSAISQSGTPQVLLLTPLSTDEADPDGHQIIADTIPRLCKWFSQARQLDIKEFRIPLLYTLNGVNPDLDNIFEKSTQGEPVSLPLRETDSIGTLCLEDLAPLLDNIFKHWESGYEVLGNTNYFESTCIELKEKIAELLGSCTINFVGDLPQPAVPTDIDSMKAKYSWYPKGSLLQDLPVIWENYCGRVEKKKRTPISRAVDAIIRQRPLLRWIELFLLWGIIEWLGRLTGNAVQFEQIDLRLVFVVLMGCTYGMNYGIVAAVLSCISLVYASMTEGIAWMSLLYDYSNWIPFIVYLTVGVVCGYLNLHSAEMVKELTRDKEVLQEKNLFLRQLYTAQTENKDLLKRQILGTQDSFGKIFDLTQRLDNLEPQMVFESAISVLEELLNNTSVSLYVTSDHNDFARLEAASASISEQLPQTLDLQKYPQILESVRGGQIWVNTGLDDDLPMYAAGIYRDGKPIILALVHRVTEQQQGLYFKNLLKVTCGLIQGSMLRAFTFSEATRSNQYYPDSMLLRPEWMNRRIEVYKQMQQSRHARFSLLEIDTNGVDTTVAANDITRLLRKSDVLGLSDDGRLLLLLAQTAAENLPIVINRLDRAGYRASAVQIEEEVLL